MMVTDRTRNQILRLCSLRLPPDRSISQCLTTPESLLRRATLLAERHDIDGKRILCVGDDDFTSLALALLGKPIDIMVLDLDLRVLEGIRNAARECGVPLRTLHYDIRRLYREQPPCDLEESFDVAVTDPPSSRDGTGLFLAVAMAGLVRGGRLYHAAPYDLDLPWTTGLLQFVQRYLAANGMAVEKVQPGFHDYDSPDAVRSAMLVAHRVRRQRVELPTLDGVEAFYPPAGRLSVTAS